MSKELEEHIIDRLNKLADKALTIARKHVKAGRKNKLACYHFGRAISTLMSVKTILFSHNFAPTIGSAKQFFDLYLEDLPSTFPKTKEIFKQYMKETHATIRFTLFQAFYAQTEFSFRIIQREKFPSEMNRNPFKLMAEKFGILPGDAPSVLNDLRNSIHNNGHYFPADGASKEYSFLGRTLRFRNGHPIREITMLDSLDICNYLLDETEKLFENSDLAEIKFP